MSFAFQFADGILLSFVRHRTKQEVVKSPMNSSKKTLRELESRRRGLNERLMNSKNLTDANNIERELWAVRAAIRHHKQAMASDKPSVAKTESSHHCAT